MADNTAVATVRVWKRFLFRGDDMGGGDTAGRRVRQAAHRVFWWAFVVVLVGCVASALLDNISLALVLGLVLALVAGTAVLLGAERVERTVTTPLSALATASYLGNSADTVTALLGSPEELVRLAAGVQRALAAQTRAELTAEERRIELEGLAADLEGAAYSARAVAKAGTLSAVLELVASRAMSTSGMDRAVLWLVEQDHLVARYDSAADQPLAPAAEQVVLGAGWIGAAAMVRTLTITPEAGGRPGAVRVAVPLEASQRVIGVLELVGVWPGAESNGQTALNGLPSRRQWALEILGPHAAAVIDANRAEARAEMLQRMDPATGLGNHRLFVSDLTIEIERATRYKRPLALVVADLDGFRAYNDALGMEKGDEAIVMFGELLAAEARGSDTVYRLGGDEFAVLTRESDAEAASVLAERLRNNLSELQVESDPAEHLTASYGVADIQCAEDGEEMLEHADAALAEARKSGPNSVAVWVEIDEDVIPSPPVGFDPDELVDATDETNSVADGGTSPIPPTNGNGNGGNVTNGASTNGNGNGSRADGDQVAPDKSGPGQLVGDGADSPVLAGTGSSRPGARPGNRRRSARHRNN